MSSFQQPWVRRRPRPGDALTKSSSLFPAAQADRASVAQIVAYAFPRSRRETRRWLVAHAAIRSYRAGETITAQGEATRTVLVLDGHVGFRRTAPGGRELIPRVVSTGELASIEPLAGRPSVVEAVALAPSLVALWPATHVRARAEGDAGLALDLLAHVLRTFEAVVERLDGFIYRDALRRVARVLDTHARLLFGEAGVLSRRFLPALVGTSREMTRRVLRSLESDGVVRRVGPDGLELVDRARLARTADPRSTP